MIVRLMGVRCTSLRRLLSCAEFSSAGLLARVVGSLRAVCSWRVGVFSVCSH